MEYVVAIFCVIIGGIWAIVDRMLTFITDIIGKVFRR